MDKHAVETNFKKDQKRFSEFEFWFWLVLPKVNYLGVRYDLHVPENHQSGDTFSVSVSLPPKLAAWWQDGLMSSYSGLQVLDGHNRQENHFINLCKTKASDVSTWQIVKIFERRAYDV